MGGKENLDFKREEMMDTNSSFENTQYDVIMRERDGKVCLLIPELGLIAVEDDMASAYSTLEGMKAAYFQKLSDMGLLPPKSKSAQPKSGSLPWGRGESIRAFLPKVMIVVITVLILTGPVLWRGKQYMDTFRIHINEAMHEFTLAAGALKSIDGSVRAIEGPLQNVGSELTTLRTSVAALVEKVGTLSSQSKSSQSKTVAGEEVMQASQNVNVRSRPTSLSERVGGLLKGDVVTILATERQDGNVWYRVALEDGEEGYVLGSLLEEADISGEKGQTESQSATVTIHPNDRFKDCADCPAMVVLPKGRVEVGSLEGGVDEQPPHPVRLSYFLGVGVTEVTFDEWKVCADEGGCSRKSPPDLGWGRGNRPVINVSWHDAKEYVEWLSKKTSKRYRLLSEAEWEYAARAFSSKAYHWGDDFDPALVSNGDRTLPIGSFPPNGFGLHDMLGNVAEYVEDCYYGAYALDVPGGEKEWAPQDGSVWQSNALKCSGRVVRGGSWDDVPTMLRASARSQHPADRPSYTIGFRVALTLN